MTSIILVGFANVCVSRVENIIWRLSSRRCLCCCCWCFCSWRKCRWQVWSIAKRRRVARLRALIKRIVQRTLVQVTRRQTRVVIAAPARVRSLRHDLSIRLTLASVILSHKKWTQKWTTTTTTKQNAYVKCAAIVITTRELGRFEKQVDFSARAIVVGASGVLHALAILLARRTHQQF